LKTTKQMWVAAALLAAACSSGQAPLTSSVSGSEKEPNSGKGDAKKSDAGSKGSSSDDDEDPADDDLCESHSVASRKATPDMLIVLDRSASMAPVGNLNGADRWTGSVDAVKQVTAEFSSKINFGLMTFPSMQAGDPTGLGGLLGGLLGGADLTSGCTAGTVNVDVGKDTADEISMVLGATMPGGLTPTASTLEAALEVLDVPAEGDQTVPPRYVLLVTDGDPNCSTGGGGGGGGGGIDPGARQATLAAIEKLRDSGIQTFVVGYQTAGTNFSQQLDQMAAAGGTGDTMHRSVSSGADLIDTFGEIAGRALSCSFRLDQPVEDATYVRVTVKGKTPKFENPGDGWTLGGDMKTVTLTGLACDDVQAGASFTVEVDCEPVFVQ